jgi:hypothetical protein
MKTTFKMPRTKVVRFVTAVEHERIVARLKGEIAAKDEELAHFDRVLDDLACVTDDMVEKLKDIVAVSNRTRQWRRLLESNKRMVMGCCGVSGCHRMVYEELERMKPFYSRKCIECEADAMQRLRNVIAEVHEELDTPIFFPDEEFNL